MNNIARNLRGGCSALALAAGLSLHAQSQSLQVAVASNGDWSISLPGATTATLTSGVAAQVNGRWLRSADYPKHEVQRSTAHGYLGQAEVWQVTNTGLSGEPDLIYQLRAYAGEPFADLQATMRNGTGASITVQAIRTVEAVGGSIADLGGPAAMDRVLSDSFSEDRPAMKIHDLGDPTDGMHRGVGSQLIYNRGSHESLFVGALTSDRFLTILRLHVDGAGSTARLARYDVDSSGTTELEEENSLQDSPPRDRVDLSLPVAPGEELSSERLLLSVSHDYHHQLETYGALIRQIHHARVDGPPLMGWWSWTAYYFGLNQGAALTNAEWEAQHLEQYGYKVFHIDEGYQYARGEYVTPDATVFPNGLEPVEYRIRGLGLLPGIWTAPFEVSVRSWVYQHHPDWLVKNAQGEPIHAGSVEDGKDPLYILDTTNPGAQQYLRDTYSKLVRQWQIHYIKMDFMDDSAIEGYYYRPHTTAMEAQRIGLKIIRDTVGNDVLLDKDGSVMLNPVGFVDYGRISQDTGHTFGASRDAATGIAARYYMNRNFFISDPDAFTVSTQTIADQSWHESKEPETLNEAQVSIALAAISGGMLEIGDNLPSLMHAPERLALVENRDLIDMVQLGRESTPVDLMSYAPSDQQPSIFWLRESDRQDILTVFNWTEHATQHTLRLADFGLRASDPLTNTDVLTGKAVAPSAPGVIQLDLPPHSVRVLKILDNAVPEQAPQIVTDGPGTGTSGVSLVFSAQAQSDNNPVLSFRWNFGDGVELDGSRVTHAWTEPGDYAVHLTATGLGGSRTEKDFTVHVTGNIPTAFHPKQNRRFEQP